MTTLTIPRPRLKAAPTRYRAILPDGTTAVRNSPTGRVYTAAVARLMGGVWSATSFARTHELAEKEASTQRTQRERSRRKLSREGFDVPEATYVVVAVEAMDATTNTARPRGES